MCKLLWQVVVQNEIINYIQCLNPSMIEKPKIEEILDVIVKKEQISDYLLVVYGPLNQDVLVSTIRLAESKLRLQQFPQGLISKTKAICAEILQNINKHQFKHDTYQPYLVIGSKDHTLFIYAGNIISEKSKAIITEKLENYLSIKEENFKSFYTNAFKNAVLTEDGNAGLGLLEMFYRSNRNFKYNINKLSENLFSFNLNIELSQQLVPQS
ncbi:MAG: DUF6272 family protein [Bacteroidia bacterium]|nr:DUF6272 family protein [Bacteroidia bacterium]